MSFITRVPAKVICSAGPGKLRVEICYRQAIIEAERLPTSLHQAGSVFVAVICRTRFIRVESAGEQWLELQGRVRLILNQTWDPIGVASHVPDEYDSYIDGLYHLLRAGASSADIASFLHVIEVGRMGIRRARSENRWNTARRLMELDLPDL